MIQPCTSSVDLGMIQACDPFHFHIEFADHMPMRADAATVGEYLDNHQDWFRRCAHPMQAEVIGKNSYAITIGKFGAFGYEVEPKIGLELLPQEQGLYKIQTIPVPDYTAPGYEVEFMAWQKLVEVPVLDQLASPLPLITNVEWVLHLSVHICFPKFIYRLPQHLIQSTGDQLLLKIVRLVNRRLTYKVQQDFHTSRGLAMPPKHHKKIKSS
jgi:hypothetical protein